MQVDQALQLRARRVLRELGAAVEVQGELAEVYNLENQDRLRFVARTTLSCHESGRTPVSILYFIRRR